LYRRCRQIVVGLAECPTLFRAFGDCPLAKDFFSFCLWRRAVFGAVAKPRKEQPNIRQYWHDLAAVTSVQEAAVLWHLSPRTVNRLCEEGKVVSTKLGGKGMWVISTRHMIALFGDPDVPENVGESLLDQSLIAS
jgi:hypothetical protein